jgi:hypothetical protein
MNIHLGFEVGTGQPVEIPLKHLAVTGQTQESGKTTTLEALITRAKIPAVAFITKRGEGSFAGGRRIPPYFRERADWQFVLGVLEAKMHQRLNIHRSFIMKACQGAHTLADVHANVQGKLPKAKGLAEGIYTELDEYLRLVIPQLGLLPKTSGVKLTRGINVMDLGGYTTELQSLVIRSVIDWIVEREENVVTIVPEAWEFIPQGRNSPVKLSAEQLVRKGAALGNFVWIDSQDMAGVDKVLLRGCPVWLIGVQREANELKRALANIPAGIKRPKPTDVATLERGQFYACWGQHAIKTYVQPTWMNKADALAIAVGRKSIDEARPPKSLALTKPEPTKPKEPEVTEHEAQQLRQQNADLQLQIEKLNQQITLLTKQLPREAQTAVPVPAAPPAAGDFEQLYAQIKTRLASEAPALIKLLAIKPELQVTVKTQTIETSLTELRGMIAKLMSEGFLDKTTNGNTVWKECKRRWNYGGNSSRAYEQLDQLTALGFLTKETDGYRAVPDMKINIKK